MLIVGFSSSRVTGVRPTHPPPACSPKRKVFAEPRLLDFVFVVWLDIRNCGGESSSGDLPSPRVQVKHSRVHTIRLKPLVGRSQLECSVASFFLDCSPLSFVPQLSEPLFLDGFPIPLDSEPYFA